MQRQFAAAGDATDSISVQQISRRQQSVFAITTTLPAGSASATSRLQQIDESLAQIAQDGVSDEELAIVQQWARNDLLIQTGICVLKRTCWLPINQDRGPASVSRDLMRYLLVGTKEIQTLARLPVSNSAHRSDCGSESGIGFGLRIAGVSFPGQI